MILHLPPLILSVLLYAPVKLVKLSALRASRLYLQEIFLVLISVGVLIRSQRPSTAGRST